MDEVVSRLKNKKKTMWFVLVFIEKQVSEKSDMNLTCRCTKKSQLFEPAAVRILNGIRWQKRNGFFRRQLCSWGI